MRFYNGISSLVMTVFTVVGAFALVSHPNANNPAESAAITRSNKNNHHRHKVWSRRDALMNGMPLVVVATAAATSITIAPEPAVASLIQPQPQGIRTVVLESAHVKLGVKLEDAILGTTATTNSPKSYPVVQAVAPDGLASVQGVVPGMVVLGQPSAAALVQRLQRGPYPFAVQFYDLSVEQTDAEATTAAAALESAKEQTKRSREEAAAKKEPPLSAKGTGLVVKTTRKATDGDCTLKARRGDTVQILYEARVASPGGPIYDSTAERGGQPVTFQLGDGKAISGVDIGLGGMCQGEVREIDIPSGLGYGRSGFEVFDVPGDVRLWWRVELLELIEGEKRFPFR